MTESLLQRSTTTDGRILRDRFLQGFCFRLNKRKSTFLVATSVRGKQFWMMLGYWPLMRLDEARTKAMEVLRLCRNGERPRRDLPPEAPTMREAYVAYCKAKGIKPSSKRRYPPAAQPSPSQVTGLKQQSRSNPAPPPHRHPRIKCDDWSTLSSANRVGAQRSLSTHIACLKVLPEVF